MPAVIDYQSAWSELGAWIAAEPNRGRQALLAKMAELAEAHRIPEDELERVLRVFGPQLVELLSDRLAASRRADHDHQAPGATAVVLSESVHDRNAGQGRPSMAVT